MEQPWEGTAQRSLSEEVSEKLFQKPQAALSQAAREDVAEISEWRIAKKTAVELRDLFVKDGLAMGIPKTAKTKPDGPRKPFLTAAQAFWLGIVWGGFGIAAVVYLAMTGGLPK